VSSGGQPRRDSGEKAFSWPNLLPSDTKPFNRTGSQNAALGVCVAAAPVIGESDNSNGSDRNYRFDYQAGVRDTFPQEGIAGLWNAEEGADGRRRRTLDKGVDQ
jgi:hypothetical protein